MKITDAQSKKTINLSYNPPNPTNRNTMKTSHTNQISRLTALRSTWASRCVLAVATVAIAASSAWAQTVTMRSQPLRFTIPKGVASSNFCTLTIPVSGLVTPGTDTINLAVTGVPGSGTAFAWLSTNGLTSNITYTATLILTNDATINGGEYEMAVEATGAASFRLPVPVQVAYIWSGNNFTNAVSTNWSSGGNWIGGVAPGSADLVVFKDQNGPANNTITNVIVSADATIASLRFSSEVAATRFNMVEILSGRKLSVTGGGLSLSLHRDSKTTAAQMETKFVGAGTLEVVNPTGQIGVLVDQQQNTTLDMRNLDNFVADVSRIGLGNHRIWPNTRTNGYFGEGTTAASSTPFRFLPLVWLAKTNVIKCSWTDPNNYNDASIRDYAIEIGNDTAAGTTQVIRFTLGNSNAFFIDSICWAHAGKGGSANNYNFNTTNSYALFRGIGGGRMTAWAQGDASGVALSGSNVRGIPVDFSNGKVDALVDRLYLARVRNNSSGFTVQGTLTIGGASLGSVFDVNTAYLGNQDVVNTNAGAVANVPGSPVGTLNVNSNATFKANRTIYLGYTISSVAGTPNYPENASGILNINNTGTLMASNIVAGGTSKVTGNNSIIMNRGRLIVTNGIGEQIKPLNNFVFTNASQLTVFNVSDSSPSIYVTNLNAANVGGSCAVNVPVLTNLLWPVTIPLISYVTAAPNIAGLTAGTLPSGVVLQSIVDNGAGIINFTFTTNVPTVLVWTGAANGNWDTTSTNWVTQVGSIPSRFTDGDSVVFNDTSSVNTITIVGSVVPGQTAAANGIAMTNTTQNYTFNGGSVVGGVSGYKAGTGSLTINAAFSPGFNVEAGSISGAGSMGATALQSGSVMTAFSGTINNGLTVSSASVAINGTVLGGLVVQSGSITNNGTIGDVTLGGTVSLQGGIYLTNGGTMYVTVPWNLPTNSVLVNNGTIEQSGLGGANGGLTVNGGKFKGTGKLYARTGTLKPDARVTFGPGSTLEIGNSPNEIATIKLATRVDFNAGSTTVFDVDTSTTNDVILLREPSVQLGHVNFGVGNNQGGTLYINKIGGPAFTTSTVLSLFDRNGNLNEPENAGPAIPKVTPQPLAGYAWDVSQTITNLLIPVTTPPFLTNVVSTATNGIQSFEFTWPDSYRGWRLEQQTNTLSVGLESPSTNWTTLVTSLGGTNSLYYPGATNDYSIYYFRSVQTISSTNAPAVFFRLVYP